MNFIDKLDFLFDLWYERILLWVAFNFLSLTVGLIADSSL
jgi:hypothetical protein